MTERFVVSPEVQAALSSGAAVVALETAVLTHGLPRPLNLEAFRRTEEAVRSRGALPAPVGLLDGSVRVGIGPEEARRLAVDKPLAKVGLAELPAAVSRGLSGGTTVAATLWACRRTGIELFATGGIGGVHRGVEKTFDVSGDLAALASFGGCVVFSGAKAILDLPKTFELLETLGVCVLGYGTDELPAFTWPNSGIACRHRADSPAEVAAIIRARDALELTPAVVVAQPPPEEVALPREELEAIMAELSGREAPSGQDLTPFLLRAVAERTAGASLAANIGLLEANARLAAEIATALRASR
jgi:pseudouridine-5'-phosphate glycosidase